MDTELVVVAYHSCGLVLALLDRLPPGTPVVVVDNALGVDGLPAALYGRPGIRYVRGEGRGFARAANLGALTSCARFLVFVNPDSAPTAPQLSQLVADLARDPGLAAVGATTVLPDGRVELGVGGWEPTVARALVHATGVHRWLPTAGLYARPVPGRALVPDWISGACLAVPRDTFLRLGGFDEGFFVYNEDMAYGRRVRQAGLGQRLRTDVLVPHLGGGSGEAKPRMFRVRGASMMRYVRRYAGLRTVYGIRLALTAGTALRAVACRAQGRRGLARAHRAYLVGLWRGDPDVTR